MNRLFLIGLITVSLMLPCLARQTDADREVARTQEFIQATQQKTAQRPIEEKHGERVDRHHDQGVSVIAPRQVAPDQDHCRAGRDAEQDAAAVCRDIKKAIERLVEGGVG